MKQIKKQSGENVVFQLGNGPLRSGSEANESLLSGLVAALALMTCPPPQLF